MTTPFVVEYGWDAPVVYLDGPGWADFHVVQVAHWLHPFRVTVCGPGADPIRWMMPGDFLTVRVAGPMDWLPGAGGVCCGYLNARTERMRFQVALLKTASTVAAVHEFGHALGLGHEGPGFMDSPASQGWKDSHLNPAGVAMKNLREHRYYTAPSHRWSGRPHDLGWRERRYTAALAAEYEVDAAGAAVAESFACWTCHVLDSLTGPAYRRGV